MVSLRKSYKSASARPLAYLCLDTLSPSIRLPVLVSLCSLRRVAPSEVRGWFSRGERCDRVFSYRAASVSPGYELADAERERQRQEEREIERDRERVREREIEI